MAYDEKLAERLRLLLADEADLTEQRMFGGVGFLLSGAMCVGVMKDGGLLLRVAPEDEADVLAEPHVDRMAMSGRPMRGWLVVAPEGVASDGALRRHVERSRAYVRTLPPKRPR